MERYEDLVSASEYEAAVFRERIVPMAPPCSDSEGMLIRQLRGSRDREVCVRVHRFQAGVMPPCPVSLSTAHRAGELLAALHEFAALDMRPNPALPSRIWRSHDAGLLAQLVEAWALERSIATAASEALQRAEGVIDQWAQQDPPSLPAHCDHKPENTLLVAGDLMILDWDEVSACDPRIEAVESGLRWARTDAGPDSARFCAFVRGYGKAGLSFGTVVEADWAKWIAGIASWFEFQAAGSLGRWAAVSSPPEVALQAALTTIRHLTDTLDQLPSRTEHLNHVLRSG